MNISELIEELEAIKEVEGNLNVCTSHDHPYWGSTESLVTKSCVNVENGQPDGPKSGRHERCVIISGY